MGFTQPKLMALTIIKLCFSQVSDSGICACLKIGYMNFSWENAN